MGTVFKKPSTRPLPAGAEVAAKGGARVARRRVRGKLRTAPVITGGNGADRIRTESATYFAHYRDADGAIKVVPTGCRDRQAAEQLPKRWEREVEQIEAGTLDRKALTAARQAAAPLEEQLAAYEKSLVAAGASNVYRGNVLRAVRKAAADRAFATTADLGREAAEHWLADRLTPPVSQLMAGPPVSRCRPSHEWH